MTLISLPLLISGNSQLIENYVDASDPEDEARFSVCFLLLYIYPISSPQFNLSSWIQNSAEAANNPTI